MYKTSKEIALLVAGAVVGFIAIPYEEIIASHIFYVLLLLLFLLFYGVGIFDAIDKFLNKIVWFVNYKFNYICIFAPYKITEKNSSWVDLTLDEIISIFKRNKKTIGIFKSSSVFKQFPVVVNPYGGVYPESDISNLRSLNEIFDYVKNGGTYVNIADIPFYYAYDENLNRAVDTTPLVDGFSLQRSFLKTALTKKLNHYVYALTKGPDFNKGIKRIIQLSSPSENLFHKDQFYDGQQGPYSPILKIPYGKGYFIFSTFTLNLENLEKYIIKLFK